MGATASALYMMCAWMTVRGTGSQSLLSLCSCTSLQWRHNDHDEVWNHQPHGCLLKRLFRRRSKKTSKLRVTGLWEGNSSGPVNSPHKGPVTRKMFPFDDVIMWCKYKQRTRRLTSTLYSGYATYQHPNFGWCAYSSLNEKLEKYQQENPVKLNMHRYRPSSSDNH